MKKSFAVIGLGRFGYSIVKELANNNADVLAIDKFEENMQNIFPIKPLIKSGDLIYKDGYIYINPKKLYVMNEILLKLI